MYKNPVLYTTYRINKGVYTSDYVALNTSIYANTRAARD